jgi:hypothetical protein
MAIAGSASEAHLAKNAAAHALRDQLVARILADEFQVLGYRTEPTKSRGPVVVNNADFLKYQPNWEQETVEVRGEFYVDLRIAPAHWRLPTAKRGRPGSADKVVAAIDALNQLANSDFCSVPRKQACARVLDHLQVNGFDIAQRGAGLTVNNISKLIVKRCGKRQL